MRTLDPILAAATAGGYGKPIARLKIYHPDFAYGGYINVQRYEMARLTCKVFSLQALTAEQKHLYKLERGVEVNGVEYVVSSPWLYPSKFTRHQTNKKKLYEFDFLMYKPNSVYSTAVAADVDAATVIQNMMSSGCTAHFLSGETWHTWQYEKIGTTVKRQEFGGFMLQLWNKYTVKMFPRDDGYILFESAYRSQAYNVSGADTPAEMLALGEIDGYIIPPTSENMSVELKWENMSSDEPPNSWNLFWEDETGSTSRLSVTYAYLSVRRLRNIGFLPSTADKAELLYISYYPESAHKVFEISMPINFEPEQGDFILIEAIGAGVVFADITESFNMPGTDYPWQTKIKGARMYYSKNEAG